MRPRQECESEKFPRLLRHGHLQHPKPTPSILLSSLHTTRRNRMADPKPKPLPVQVQKPTPYTFDLGLLLANDPNPLHLTSTSTLEDDLASTARDGAQALLNQLLSTCPIASTPAGVLLSLPAISTNLPREKVYLRPELPSYLPTSLIPFPNDNNS